MRYQSAHPREFKRPPALARSPVGMQQDLNLLGVRSQHPPLVTDSRFGGPVAAGAALLWK